MQWKGVPATKMGNMAEKRVLYEMLVEQGGGEDETSIPALWKDTDKDELERLQMLPLSW
jgi:hypothetical protein